jgi:hypothetical protein
MSPGPEAPGNVDFKSPLVDYAAQLSDFWDEIRKELVNVKLNLISNHTMMVRLTNIEAGMGEIFLYLKAPAVEAEQGQPPEGASG